MVSAIISRLFILTFGTIYPGYRSYKAIRTKNVKEYVKWMMYWVVFAGFLFFEALADTFVSFWCPFYYELKILFVVWLLSPYTRGASFLYRRVIHPTLSRHEPDIDEALDKAKTDGIEYARTLSQHGFQYAKEMVAQVALRSQSHLVSQLAGRKTLSMNDLTGDAEEEDGVQTRRKSKKRLIPPAVEETRSLRSADLSTFSDEEGNLAEEGMREEVKVEEGYYDSNGKLVVEREFKFLEGATRTRSSRLRPQVYPASAFEPMDSAGYATLPRSGARTRRQLNK